MSFLEKIGLDVIKNEKEMLRALRTAAEQWYNELTTPFLPVLQPRLEGWIPGITDRERLARIAAEMFNAERLINSGDALANRLAEIEHGSGIPFFSKRAQLRIKARDYLDAGDFLKKFAYSDFGRGTTSTNLHQVTDAAVRRWQEFREAKDDFVRQVNEELARIG